MAQQQLTTNYLKTFRRRAGLSQRDLGFLMGYSPGVITRYERGRRVPSLATALAFEAALGVPVNQLFSGMSQQIGDEVDDRVVILAKGISPESRTRRLQRKLGWLRSKGRNDDQTEI